MKLEYLIETELHSLCCLKTACNKKKHEVFIMRLQYDEKKEEKHDFRLGIIQHLK